MLNIENLLHPKRKPEHYFKIFIHKTTSRLLLGTTESMFVHVVFIHPFVLINDTQIARNDPYTTPINTLHSPLFVIWSNQLLCHNIFILLIYVRFIHKLTSIMSKTHNITLNIYRLGILMKNLNLLCMCQITFIVRLNVLISQTICHHWRMSLSSIYFSLVWISVRLLNFPLMSFNLVCLW